MPNFWVERLQQHAIHPSLAALKGALAEARKRDGDEVRVEGQPISARPVVSGPARVPLPIALPVAEESNGPGALASHHFTFVRPMAVADGIGAPFACNTPKNTRITSSVIRASAIA